MTTGNAPDVMVWVDIETTGLDPKLDVPLELGIKVTDPDLRVTHQKSWYIREEGWLARLEKNPEVYEMHKKSGLLEELLVLPKRRRLPDGQIASWGSNQAAFLAWQWLTEDLELPANEYPMCGSSVHFDRKFAERHLFVFNAFFTYRHIDVSTLKELTKIYLPDIYDAIRNNPRFDKKNAKHRVLADIDATLDELRQYLANFLLLPGRLEEIDRNARAYGFEVGRGKDPKGVIHTSPDNPFMDKGWKDNIPEEIQEHNKIHPNQHQVFLPIFE